tara:strand:+ start:381 stop:1394 length:1014 start_codon:yes stop_codon:yes gene_type:complete
MTQFSKKIIEWQRQKGRNNLPWQMKSAYEVWISEIMLQQTQVETVIPYYLKFIKKFPEIKKLANSSEDVVMSLWSGLGYYSRARNIHKTAKIILREFDGEFPRYFDDLIKLPGIGPSTAGAILSLAFNAPGIILDGNVKRVIARYKGIRNPIDNSKTQIEIKSFAETFLPKNSYRQYSQGIMDLGSILCRPKNPSCNLCPVNKNCLALKDGLQEIIPHKNPSKPKKEKNINWLLISSNNKILLKRNENKGIWKNLWLFPEKNVLSNENLQLLEEKESLPDLIHNLSHRKLNISTKKFSIKNKDRLKIDRSQSVWVSKEDSVKMGMPKPIKEIIANYL